MKKTISILLAAALALCLLAGCGKKAVSEPDMSALADLVDAAIGNEGALVETDANYINYAAYTVKINTIGIAIDEYGIFKGADEAQAKDIKTAVENYLQLREDTWMKEYRPEEFPKLQAAEVWTEGNYVMYAILSDDAKAAASGAFTGAFMEG